MFLFRLGTTIGIRALIDSQHKAKLLMWTNVDALHSFLKKKQLFEQFCLFLQLTT